MAAQALDQEIDQAADLARASAAVEVRHVDRHVHRILMRALARQHRPEEALRQFETLRRSLDQELGVPPEAATAKLPTIAGT